MEKMERVRAVSPSPAARAVPAFGVVLVCYAPQGGYKGLYQCRHPNAVRGLAQHSDSDTRFSPSEPVERGYFEAIFVDMHFNY